MFSEKRRVIFLMPGGFFLERYYYVCAKLNKDAMKMWKWTVAVILSLLAVTACFDRNEAEYSMPEAVFHNILQRTSVREYITDKPIEQGKIDTLLRAAMAAPSGMDRRPWEFVVVNKREILDSLAANLSNARMLAHAPLAVIVCGNERTSSYWYLDCAAAAQNILLTACSLGLGAVWTAAFPYEDRMDVIRSCVCLPGDVKPLCIIPIGYPAKESVPKDKWNESRIHYNCWK